MSEAEIVVAADPNQAIVAALQEQGFPQGLIDSLLETVAYDISLRIWILDNSGSMRISDGSRLVENPSQNAPRPFTSVQTTRWQELQENAIYHAKLAGLLKAPTIFRLLNHPGARVGAQQFTVADNPGSGVQESMNKAVEIINKTQPEGYTPLLFHIKEIKDYVQSIEPQLTAAGKKAAVIIATDGVPTDASQDQMVQHLNELQQLPVYLIFRLCTDETQVIEYYNDIDQQLEKNVENLDDFTSEAKEVYKVNPWINYTLTLHRVREMGQRNKLFDLIDERAFTIDEIGEYVKLLFGQSQNNTMTPDPAVDFDSFCDYLRDEVLSKQKLQWNPVLSKMGHWVDVDILQRLHGTRKPNFDNGQESASSYPRSAAPAGAGHGGGEGGGCCIIS